MGTDALRGSITGVGVEELLRRYPAQGRCQVRGPFQGLLKQTIAESLNRSNA